MSKQFTVPRLSGATNFCALILHTGKVSHFSCLPRPQTDLLADLGRGACAGPPPPSCIWLHLKFQASARAFTQLGRAFFCVCVFQPLLQGIGRELKHFFLTKVTLHLVAFEISGER